MRVPLLLARLPTWCSPRESCKRCIIADLHPVESAWLGTTVLALVVLSRIFSAHLELLVLLKPFSPSLDMNLLRAAIHPVSLCTFFCDRAASILMIASIFSRLASIPRWLTINPSNFSAGTPKTHFSGLSFHRYRRRLLKTSCKSSMKFSEFSVLITTSST
jgi:hypothetical protein